MSDMSITRIEAALAEDRAALARSLAALRDRFAPSALLAEGKAALHAQAAPLVAQIDAAVRARPLTAAVAGLAAATLVLGARRSGEAQPALAGTRYEALTRWEDEGGPVLPEPVDRDEDWLTEALGLKARAQDLLARLDDAARRGLAPAARLAAHRAEIAAALARETGQALGRGLEGLTEAARAQALTARERVYLARVALADRARSRVEDHPVAAGLAIAAAGAAAAWLFPRTETEDRYLGPARDRLVDDARRAALDEAVRASALAQSFAQALRSDMATLGRVAGRPSAPDGPGLHP